MNFPSVYFLFRCLAADTFRRALAAKTFWLMGAVSLLCILFCLGVGLDGDVPLRPDGEIELIGGDNKPLTGPNPKPGFVTLGFGAVRMPLFRDGAAQVRFLQTLLAFWVAGAIGTLAALIWTAGFLPEFLDPQSASVLLAKPVPRWLVLVGKYVGVLALVAVQTAFFFVGTWLALGLKTGYWPPQYLAAVPLFLLHFAVIFASSVLVAVYSRSTSTAIFGAILFWFVCFAANFGGHAVVALPYLETGSPPFSPVTRTLAQSAYLALPKPGDFIILLDQALLAREDFEVLPASFRAVVDHGHFNPALSVVSSLLFGALLLTLAGRQFEATEY